MGRTPAGCRERRHGRVVPAAVAALLGVGGFVSPVSVRPAGAAALACGSIVLRSVVLTGNITGCTGPGLVIGADDITVNLGGFVLSGTAANTNTGINTNFHRRVILKNGTVTSFGTGVRVLGSDSVTVKTLTVKGNRGAAGLLLDGASASVVSQNKVVNNAVPVGVDLLGGSSSSVTDNKIANNGIPAGGGQPARGIGVRVTLGDDQLLSGNLIRGNLGGGVAVHRPSRIAGNTVSDNGGHGIHVADEDQIQTSMVSGNVVCNNARHGLLAAGAGNTISENDVGAGATGCLPNGRVSGVDLFDEGAVQGVPMAPCPNTWSGNFTAGDTFNHPCVTA